MSRSAAQIATAIAERMLDANPTVDTSKGPFFDISIVPPANEIAAAESEADRVATLYSRFADRPGSMSDAEIAALGRSFRVPTPTGSKSKGLVTFYATSLPSTNIDIPVGAPIGSPDGVYVFVTTTAITGISAAAAASYLDSSSGRYLFTVEAQAVNIGGGYNLPAHRITRMLQPIQGITGVYNPVAFDGGSSPNQTQNYLSAIQDSFLARDTGTIAGLAVELSRRGVDQAIQIIDSSSRDAFFRPVKSSALDVYMVDGIPATYEDVFTSSVTGLYALSRLPVLAVDAVYVNGALLTSDSYAFEPDTTPAYRRSASANDRVRILYTLASSDIVRVRYTYASSVWNLQSGLVEADIMGADILARLTNPLYAVMAADIVCPVSSLASIRATALSFTTTTLSNTFRSSDVTQYLQAVHSELSLVRWSVFGRRGRTGVETVSVPPGFSLKFKDTADLQLRVVGV